MSLQASSQVKSLKEAVEVVCVRSNIPQSVANNVNERGIDSQRAFLANRVRFSDSASEQDIIDTVNAEAIVWI